MVQIREFDEKLREAAMKLPAGTRREFLQNLILASGGTIMVGGWLVEEAEAQAPAAAPGGAPAGAPAAAPQGGGQGGGQAGPRYGLVLVDFNKCTGCRTCESICSNSNHTVSVNGETLADLGNPALANIRVKSYYPAVDIPVHCVVCSDAPCVAACPIPADPTTKRKALYRDEKLQTIKVDTDRCIACGLCAAACKDQRTNSILLNADTNKPEGMCTLCNGDPQCVKYCPYGALSYSTGGVDTRHYAFKPDELAVLLTEHYYYPIEETTKKN
jgi:Fe-S-cluster-containing hydrogenase component 2